MADAMPSTSQGGGGDTGEEQPVELIHGVSQLPDGYGKIFNAAAMLSECCLNAVYTKKYDVSFVFTSL